MYQRLNSWAWALCVLSLLLCYVQGLQRAPGAMDLPGYMAMGAAWLAGQNPYLNLDPNLLARFDITEKFAFPPILPHGLPLLSLMTLLPWEVAKLAVWTASFISLVGALYLIVDRFGRDWPTHERLLFIAILAQSRLVQSIAYRGQISITLFFMMLLALRYQERGRPILAGALVAVTIIKPTFALPLIALLLYRRAFGVLLSAGVIAGSTGLLAAVSVGLRELITSYPEAVRNFIAKDEPSWAGSWHLTNWHAILYEVLGTATPAANALAAALSLVAIAAIAIIVWRLPRSEDDGWVLAIFILFAQVATYHRVYDGIQVFVVLALMWSLLRNRSPLNWSALEILTAALAILFVFVFSIQSVSQKIAYVLEIVPALSALNAWVSLILFACIALVALQRPQAGVIRDSAGVGERHRT